MVLAFLLGVLALIAAEVWVLVQVVHLVGVLPAVALLILVPMLGIGLMKREGLAALRRTQEAVARNELPAAPMLDGLLLLVAGACLIVPGFVTDGIGLLLLLPPVRAMARGLLRVTLIRRIGRAGDGTITIYR
jgi:UPF0716 protein FxsA